MTEEWQGNAVQMLKSSVGGGVWAGAIREVRAGVHYVFFECHGEIGGEARFSGRTGGQSWDGWPAREGEEEPVLNIAIEVASFGVITSQGSTDIGKVITGDVGMRFDLLEGKSLAR